MQGVWVMDVLTVFANSDSVVDDHAVVRVYWCTGLHRKKAIDVRLTLTCQDRLCGRSYRDSLLTGRGKYLQRQSHRDQTKNRGIQGRHQENGKAIHP